ncbi:MAG: SRPBCC domain-containing protein [Betaproteobacteria bacterium]|nr:SRPBCC domain-containing protein [Betaproteobacteria bacterium]
MKNLLVAIAISFIAAAPLCAQEKSITEKVTVKAKVDDVWRAWTSSAGIKTFFAPDANVELKIDGPFQIYIDPTAEPGMKGADDMRILAFQENKMLTFTWNAPPSLPEARKQRTVVIVRFEARGDAITDVTLTHLGWGEGGEWDKAHGYFSRSWPNVLKNLKKRFDDGPVDWTPWLEQLKKMKAAKK